MTTTLLALLAALLTTPTATPTAAQPGSEEVAAWREDLRLLRHALPATHPDAFANLERGRWESAAAALEARLPALDRNERFVELQRLVALLGDAHTSISVVQPSLELRYYPLELHLFDDGLFVRRAASQYDQLVGARVVAIGRVSAAEALDAVATTISHENEWCIKAFAPLSLTVPEVLDGLGLVDDLERLPITVERQGRRTTVTVTPAGALGGPGHRPSLPIDRSGWKHMLAGPEPRWMKHPDRLFWFEPIPEHQAVYVSYRAVASPPHGPSNRELWDQVFAVVDERGARRLILDLRENTGGNGFLNRYPVQQILRRPAIDRPGGLMVIIGRFTFSAAQQLVNDLEWWTQATFIGEPTGQKPSQYGDHEQVTLPNSGISVRVSTVYHQAPNPLDRRSFVPPDVYVPLLSEQYAAGLDPALEAALSYRPRVLSSQIESLLRAGDGGGAHTALAEAAGATAHRFRDIEAEINTLGYRLLNEHQLDLAIRVFELNAETFPTSANVHDSLGEALERAGRSEDALAAYRRALAIDPTYPSSLAALRRLQPSPPQE